MRIERCTTRLIVKFGLKVISEITRLITISRIASNYFDFGGVLRVESGFGIDGNMRDGLFPLSRKFRDPSRLGRTRGLRGPFGHINHAREGRGEGGTGT